MPAKSKAQQGFMGAELARLRAGQETDTGMGADQLGDFAGTKTAKLPEHVKHTHKKPAPHRGPGRKSNPRGGIPY
jgi:hypothetical protein